VKKQEREKKDYIGTWGGSVITNRMRGQRRKEGGLPAAGKKKRGNKKREKNPASCLSG